VWYAPRAGGGLSRRTCTPVISPPAMASRGSPASRTTKPISWLRPVRGHSIRRSSRCVAAARLVSLPATCTRTGRPSAPAVEQRPDVEVQSAVVALGRGPARRTAGQPQNLVVAELERRQVDRQRLPDRESGVG